MNNENTVVNEDYPIEEIIEPVVDFSNLKNAEIINGQKVNNSKLIEKEHFAIRDEDEKYSKLSITNFKVYSDSELDVSRYSATVTNKDDVPFLSNTIVVYFCDEKDYCFHIMDYFMKEDIQPGESIEIGGYDIADFINAYDYKVRIMVTY